MMGPTTTYRNTQNKTDVKVSNFDSFLKEGGNNDHHMVQSPKPNQISIDISKIAAILSIATPYIFW